MDVRKRSFLSWEVNCKQLDGELFRLSLGNPQLDVCIKSESSIATIVPIQKKLRLLKHWQRGGDDAHTLPLHWLVHKLVQSGMSNWIVYPILRNRVDEIHCGSAGDSITSVQL